MHDDKVRILQINIGRSSAAHDVMMATALETGADVIILSEPNLRRINANPLWYTDKRGDAAMLIFSGKIRT